MTKRELRDEFIHKVIKGYVSIEEDGQRSSKIPMYEEGRKCAFPSCEVRLSIYNKGPFCWVHSSVIKSTKNRKIAH
jgi:hypothetical protein